MKDYVKTDTMKRVEEEMGVEIHLLLRALYVDKNMDKRDIAELLGVSRFSITDWLNKCGIYSHRLKPK